MADTKISGLTALTGANTASGDLLTIVDVSDTTMAATGTNKKITLTELQSAPVSAGTANGVLYLNGSKVATSGSDVVYTGNFGIGTAAPTYKLAVLSASGAQNIFQAGQSGVSNGYTITSDGTNLTYQWYTGGSEQMRLNSTGLGIGTSSPSYKLHVAMPSSGYGVVFRSTGATNNPGLFIGVNESTKISTIDASGSTTGLLAFNTSGVQRMLLDDSGNLGLGVTPSAWSGYKAFEFTAGGAIWGASNGNFNVFSTNTFYNGSNWIYKTTNPASYYNQSGGVHAWFNAASGTAGNAITFTQAMTLDASGNLGIGTTSPSSYGKLAVGSTGSIAILGSTGSAGTTGRGLTLYNSTSTDGNNFAAASFKAAFSSSTYSSGYGYFETVDSSGTLQERARIDSSGNLLVGKTSLDDTVVGFSVSGSTSQKGSITSTLTGTTSGNTTLHVYSTGASAYRFYVGMQGQVYATNTTITAISDQRLKENIQDIDVGLDAIMSLKPRKFDWKAGKGKDIKGDRGWIAQEFEQVFPDMVSEWKDPAPEGEEPYKAVNADLIPVLVKAIQEQQAIITQLTVRVAQLESN